MKIILTILISAFLYNGPTLEKVRKEFQNAHTTAEDATSFNHLMHEDLDINKNIKLAYLGASETILGQFGGSISERISIFKIGKSHIEQAVANSPTDVEIRLVRLMIQYNAPSILGYHNHIYTDKEFIINNFHNQAPDLKTYIRDIAKNTEVFNPEEKSRLK